MRRLGVFISAWAVLLSLSLIPVAIGMKEMMIVDFGRAVPVLLLCMLAVSAASFGVFFILHWRYDTDGTIEQNAGESRSQEKWVQSG